MSYEDTNCPCGDKKRRETMICSLCEATFLSTKELAVFNNSDWPVEARRIAAVRILSMCRRRKKDYPPDGEFFKLHQP